MDRFLVEPGPDDEEYQEYMSLFMNQEYHFWAEHLYSIGDGIWQLSKALHPHAARKDTRRDLASMGLLRPTGIKKLRAYANEWNRSYTRKFSDTFLQPS
jgi:phage major head subunit gpT-like protein